jgi:hypothetical protein
MRESHPFRADDLSELDERLLSRARAVVSIREVFAGNKHPDVIGLRHDCDSYESLATAMSMAEWEAERGYRSTYYILHTSPYWERPLFRERLEAIALCGHEIGIHTNALAEALRTGRNPDEILEEALATLRGYGFTVRGAAGHGDPFCNRDRGEGEITFANDEQFLECPRPQEGSPRRNITRGNITLRLSPRPLAHFGLDYEALFLGLPNPFRMSDSGGRWLFPFSETVEAFQAEQSADDPRQLHLLIHPDWWAQAFTREAVAA